MVQNIYYIKSAIKRIQRKLAFFVKRKQVRPQAKFALQFADLQIHELLSEFNLQVGLRAWSSMRPYHDKALIDEFERRGIDTSSIHDGRSITFAHPISYDLQHNKLVTLC